ncbi:MAG: ATP-dependent DNA helicase [Methanobacterium sp.]|nr:ATP-dependent DNA helicase [Methanobacterium sp.]
MDNGFFCNKCGMIKDNCVCVKDGFALTKASGIPKSRKKEIKIKYPDLDTDIIENFPFPEPRQGKTGESQLEIIGKIKKAFDEGYHYVLLEAGTGTGKSAIATTLAGIYQPAYILTMTKQLQSQYGSQFGYPLVKGRGNFSCLETGLENSCDMGTCQTIPRTQKFVCEYGISKSPFDGGSFAFEDAFGTNIYYRSQEHCNYWKQKATAVNSPVTLMNYDYALLELNYVKHFGKRRLMVLDEAHNIEDKLMARLEVNIYNKRLENDIKKTIPPNMMSYENPAEWIIFLESLYESYKEIAVQKMPKNKADRINRTKLRLLELLTNLDETPENWVVDKIAGGITFKPLKVDSYAEDRLFRHADNCLFMSATILDADLFCKWLGIEPQEAYKLSIKSSFPATARPVHLKMVGNMSRRSIKRTAPKTIPVLKKIIDYHRYEKGLIHTHNYNCQKYIMDKIKNNRLIDHNSRNREYQLHKFEESQENLVLVSPSMGEGVDLPYEKCQFQIIYKIPFPYLGDRQVNQRKLKDPKWYAYKTVMTLIQAYGRGMRAEDDYCETYILDGNFRMLLNNRLYRNLIPEFFKEAIQRD